MATNYPDVVPGEPISFSAQRENDMRHLLNLMNGMSSGAISGGVGNQTRLKVYNSTNEILPAGAAVTFADGAIIDEAVPAAKYKSGAIAYGVLEGSLEPDHFGTAIISGPVNVEIQGGSGKFANPSDDGKSFVLGGTGVQVLAHHEKTAVILLGGSGSQVKLVQLTSVPPIGFGAGTAKVVRGFSDSGAVVLEDEEIPVIIPGI